jgi:lysophospholipase L1-like esterase
MAAKIQIRNGTAAQWTTANTLLAIGEVGIENDTRKMKSGDGVTAWNSLPYLVTDSANGLKSATATVSVSSATAPTTGQVLTATGASTATWQTPASASAEIENWVFEGDSWTQDYGPDAQKTWPFYIAKIARKGISFNNVATAGQSALQMVSTFSSQVTPLLTTASGRKSLLFLFAGINDVYSNDAAAVLNVRDNLRSMWTTARANGALVCAFTLPRRGNDGGAWSQANWRAVNAQIIADSSYYDFIVRTDIVFSSAATAEYTDGIHITTAAHQKLASQIYRAINGFPATPSIWPRACFVSANVTTLTASVVNYMGFNAGVGSFDDNGDISNVNVGGFNVKTFTAPLSGTYAVDVNFLAANTNGAAIILSAYVTPLATGVPEEYRLQYVISTSSFHSLSGTTGQLKLKEGDTLKIGINPSIAGVACLNNDRLSLFSVSLISPA